MDENTTEQYPVTQFSEKRPTVLTILCIFTFIGSGMSAISSFFVALAYDMIPMAIKESPFPDTETLIEMIKLAGAGFFAIMGVLYLLSLAGALLMFKLRKTGFHFYTLSQLVMLILPSIMISGFVLPVSNMLLTGSFILAYGVNIKIMR